MKMTLEKFIENKTNIFNTIVSNIESALNNGQSQVYIKGLKVGEETIDVVARQENWEYSINRALEFYKSQENYESCAKCQKLLDLVRDQAKKTEVDNG